jgi:hypothetical protein
LVELMTAPEEPPGQQAPAAAGTSRLLGAVGGAVQQVPSAPILIVLPPDGGGVLGQGPPDGGGVVGQGPPDGGGVAQPAPTEPAAPTPVVPLAAGEAAGQVVLDAARLTELFQVALAAVVPAIDGTPPTEVVWYDADSEVLVHLDRTRVVVQPGLVLVAMTLESTQTGSGELLVPFAVGAPGTPAGMVAVTEPRPRGPAALADRWGDAVTAAAYRALLDVSHAVSLLTGVDEAGARLIPGALLVDSATVQVVPQARHASDQVPGR